MKRKLSAILTGLLSIAPSIGFAQDKPLEDRIKVTNPMIETEIRKWGPWVGERIESDYTDGKRTKGLAFYLEDINDDFILSAERDRFATYNPEANSARFPTRVSPSEQKLLEHSVNHELAHYIVREKGLFSDPRYSGPTKEKIFELAAEAMALPENQRALEHAEHVFSASIEYRAAAQRLGGD